jgi:antitoxin component of MazEF toxin-antitoxin module
MKLKINNVPGYSGIINVETDNNGTILDKFWRRRSKDSLIDGCVEIVKPKKQEKAK